MERKLRIACFNFNHACMTKLESKEKQGWYGWGNPDNKESLEEDLIIHTKKPLTQNNLVDISNYCNFLWNLIEKGKEIN